MPVVPSSLLQPIWSEFEALLIEHSGGPPPEFDSGHPLDCQGTESVADTSSGQDAGEAGMITELLNTDLGIRP